MALQFQPPPDWLLQEYAKRKSPAQIASEGANNALSTYVAYEGQQAKSQQDKLDGYIKAYGEGGPGLASDYAKRVGLQNPPALPGAVNRTQAGPGGMAGASPNPMQPAIPPAPMGPEFGPNQPGQGVPMQGPALPGVGMGMKAEQAPQSGMGASSPIIAHFASLMAPAQAAPGQAPSMAPPSAVAPTPKSISGLGDNPEDLLNQGKWGRGQLEGGERLASFRSKMQDSAQKDLENAPRSANQLRQDFTLAGKSEMADEWIAAHAPDSLNNPDEPLINVAQIKEAKDWLGTGAQQQRSDYFGTMGNVQTQKLREGLIKDAKTTLDPMFQQGEGRAQMQRLNNIGRTEPLITQMLGQKRGGDPRQMVELATRVDAVLKGSPGGQQAIEGINQLVPKTALGKFASWVEWFNSEPFGTQQQAFIHRYADTIKREKGAIQGQVKQTAERGAGTLRVLKSQFPDDYNAIVNPYLEGKYTELTGEKIPTISSDDELDALPSGSKFKDPSGQEHTKR